MTVGFFFSSRRRHTRYWRDWSSDVCSSDLLGTLLAGDTAAAALGLGFLPVSLIGEAMLWAAAALTLVTGWDYLTAGLRHAAEHDATGGPQPPAERGPKPLRP